MGAPFPYSPPENLFRRLQELDDEIANIRLSLTEPKLGNPKYTQERVTLSDRLTSVQNEKINLLLNYVGYLGGNPVTGSFPREGDWVLRLAHIGPSEARTAQGRAVISGASMQVSADPWMFFDHEVERLVRSIEHLEGAEQSPRRRPDISSLMHDDMVELLRALGLGDHARPISPHEVMVQQVIPAVKAVVAIVDGYDALEKLKR